MLVFNVLKDFINVRALAIVILAGKVNSKFCNGGHICSPPKECCPLGCCLVFASPGYRPTKTQTSEASLSVSNFLLWNHWLLWILLVLLLLVLFCGCGLWKKRQFLSNRLYRRTSRNEEERSEIDSTGSCYPPPQYSRCSSFHYAPPPYNEVTSKPDLYPLVISYKSDNGKFGDNCVMVQYFRNYVVHPALSSAGNAAIDSIHSSFFSSQGVPEVESNFPPSYEESRNTEPDSSGSEPVHSTNHYSTQVSRVDNDAPEILVGHCNDSTEKGTGVPVESVSPVPLSLFQTGKTLPGFIGGEYRPRHQYLSTIDKIFMKPDSSNSSVSHSAHQYSSDVILAQPQRYCESSGDLHYDSSDILNNFGQCLLRTNGSYSSEDNLSQARGSLQDFVSSEGLSHSQFSNLDTVNFSTSSEISSLQGCATPDSPPRAISPTGEFRNLLEKIQQLPSEKDGGTVKFYERSAGDSSSTLAIRPSKSSDSPEDEFEQTSEKTSLLNTFVGFESNKSGHRVPVRPTKLFSESGNFPRRSKTFYLPFCHVTSSLGSKKISHNNSASSNSAPVTPITTNGPNLPSQSLHLIPSANKLGSKKNLQISQKCDSKLLLCEEDEDDGDDYDDDDDNDDDDGSNDCNKNEMRKKTSQSRAR